VTLIQAQRIRCVVSCIFYPKGNAFL